MGEKVSLEAQFQKAFFNLLFQDRQLFILSTIMAMIFYNDIFIYVTVGI